LSKNKNVSKLVEKYRNKYPDLERDLLRKLIRSENGITSPSDLRKLDRYLKTAFESEVKLSDKEKSEARPSRFGFFEWLKYRGEHEEQKQDRAYREAECKLMIQKDRMRHMSHMRPEEALSLEQEAEIERKWRKEYGLDKE